jgi:hypothetical protein
VIYCSAVTVLELPASAPGLVYRRLHWSSKTVDKTVGHNDDVSDDVVHTWPALICLDEPLCTRLHSTTPASTAGNTSAVEQARSAVTRHQHVSALALELHKYATTAAPSTNSSSGSSSSSSISSSSSGSNKQWARALTAERLESHFIVGRVTRTIPNGRRDGCYLVLVQRAVPAAVPSLYDSSASTATAAATATTADGNSSASSGSGPATATAAATAAAAVRPLTAGSRPVTAAARPLTAAGQVYDADAMDLALLGALCR